ncbi:MAG: repressor LexA [Syntrophobacterales bacterium]|nr:MAG: repressor LexA [Syntrophobacterales bacterium]
MLTNNSKNTLTVRQREVLSFLIRFLNERGYPPTVREIARHFGLKGPRSPKKRLDALEEKGYIRRRPGKSRAIEVMGVSPSQAFRLVPLVGKVRAGDPSVALEDFEAEVALDRSLARGDETFFLRVKGDSMIGDHIRDGDLALVHPQPVVDEGEISVVLIDDEATVKRVYRAGDALRLQPSNPTMKPIIVGTEEGRVTIVGKVVGIFRKMV